jgi:hypothetical protein
LAPRPRTIKQKEIDAHEKVVEKAAQERDGPQWIDSDSDALARVAQSWLVDGKGKMCNDKEWRNVDVVLKAMDKALDQGKKKAQYLKNDYKVLELAYNALEILVPTLALFPDRMGVKRVVSGHLKDAGGHNKPSNYYIFQDALAEEERRNKTAKLRKFDSYVDRKTEEAQLNDRDYLNLTDSEQENVSVRPVLTGSDWF